MTRVNVHLKLPAALVEAVDTLAARDLTDRTSWVMRALTSCCEAKAPDDVDSLSDRIAALRRDIEANGSAIKREAAR
jgi:hypothetical protein